MQFMARDRGTDMMNRFARGLATVTVALTLASGCGPSESGNGAADGGGGGGPDAPNGVADAGPINIIDAPACLTSQATAEEASVPVDIIWFVDTSGSMDWESALVSEELDDFATIIDSWGLDYQVVMVAERGTGDNQVCVDPPLAGANCGDNTRFRHVNQKVDSEDGLKQLIETYPQYQGVLRPDSLKHFIAVSDDNANPDKDWFLGELPGLTNPGFGAHQFAPNGFIFHSIVAFGTVPIIGCISLVDGTFGAAIGDEYLDLSAMTGGVEASVCEDDWDPIFNALAAAIMANTSLPCTFDIPEPMNGDTLDPGRVNFVFTPSNGQPQTIGRVSGPGACNGGQGWFYDDPLDPTQIEVCPATCQMLEADAQGSVDIQFGCATIVL